MTMILTLDDVKTQPRLKPNFMEHDDILTKMVAATQKSIKCDYYCKLAGSNDELQALPEGVRGFVVDEDIQLVMQYLVGDAYLNGFTDQWLETAAARHLPFSLQEDTV